MWLAQKFASGRLDYSIAQYVEITGPLDADLLVRAAEEVFRQSEAVHVRFATDGTDPRQFVDGTAAFALPLPNDPALRGAQLQAQTVIVDPATARALPLTLTNALRVSSQ